MFLYSTAEAVNKKLIKKNKGYNFSVKVKLSFLTKHLF